MIQAEKYNKITIPKKIHQVATIFEKKLADTCSFIFPCLLELRMRGLGKLSADTRPTRRLIPR